MRKYASQRTPVGGRNHRDSRRASHRLSFAFVLFLGCRLRHYLGQGLVVRQFVAGDLVSHFAFALEFAFSFALEFMKFVQLLLLFTLQKGAGGLTQDRPERPSDRRAHHGRCNLSDFPEDGGGALQESSDAFEELFRLHLTLELAFALELSLAEQAANDVADCTQPSFALQACLAFALEFVQFMQLAFTLKFVKLMQFAFALELAFTFAQEASDDVADGAKPTLTFQACLSLAFHLALVEFLFEFQFQFAFVVRHDLPPSEW
jgi:hypothetical protein